VPDEHPVFEAWKPGSSPSRAQLQQVADRLDEVLERYSDKDWAYSRIALEVRPLSELAAPYVLWLEWIPVGVPEGRKAYKSSEDEVTWGERHSSELGMLEIVSLRLNRALMSVGAPEDFNGCRPVIRMMKRSDLENAGIKDAFWYNITEVQGDEFDNR
jgi:hypothetical protein